MLLVSEIAGQKDGGEVLEADLLEPMADKALEKNLDPVCCRRKAEVLELVAEFVEGDEIVCVQVEVLEQADQRKLLTGGKPNFEILHFLVQLNQLSEELHNFPLLLKQSVLLFPCKFSQLLFLHLLGGQVLVQVLILHGGGNNAELFGRAFQGAHFATRPF